MSTDTISVIIPAHNAASTIERTLQSVAAQTSDRWEVVVVDDGSVDGTADVVDAWTRRDQRFHLVQQSQGGVSAARNTGLRTTVGRWVLFLDADDVVTEGYFAAALAMLEANSQLDGIRCRWAYESGSGVRRVMADPLSEPGATLLAVTTETCPLAVHACVLARVVVDAVGGFDETLFVGEDWDLWTRLGLLGVQLGVLDAAYAVYVLRSGSASRRDFARVHADCVTVIRRAHDAAFGGRNGIHVAAVASSQTEHDVNEAIRSNLLWVVALAAGAGGDVNPLLDAASPMSRLDLDPGRVASVIFSEAPLGGGFLSDEWPLHWSARESGIRATVASFTAWAGDPDAARPILRSIETRIAALIDGVDRVRIGATLSVSVDLGSLIAPIDGLNGVEQVLLRVRCGATSIGCAEVAVLDRVLAPDTIGDAIRHQLAASTLRTVRRRPTLLRSIIGPIDFRRAAYQGARLMLDLPGHESKLGRELLKGFARTVVNSSTRGTVTYEAPSGSMKDHPPAGGGDWEAVFAEPDPWSYSNNYEQLKYQQTLSLLTDFPAERALELACAEGHFTSQLAPLVGHLVATDISVTALERAAQRCAGHDNIEFQLLDLTNDALPSDLDLIVCSEGFYYYDLSAVEALAVRIKDALRPGGVIVSAHANLLTDEPHRTGFDWGHAVTGAVLREVLAATPGLVLERELVCDLYRILRFRRALDGPATEPRPEPERIEHATPLEPLISRMVVWGGFVTTREEAAREEMTDFLPVLMYHSIADSGTDQLARYRTSPEAFEAQLAYLRRHGYVGITLGQWWYQLSRREPLDGRAVLLTFDDGYSDFYENAWPLLDAYKFPATVFVVADAVGGRADWDSDLNDPPTLMDWPTIRRLAAAGVDFGSHSGSHRALTAMTPREALTQERAARATFEREMGQPVSTIAYPYGAVDEGVRQTMRAAGYQIGVEVRPGLATVWDDPMAIPRMEVRGDHDIGAFVGLLGAPSRRSALRKAIRSARRRSGR
ncbi:MAG TPA: glycosyltransferase [Ilumatobacteraceae bacterium]|nr:glycosyltransferase [Ilumatobacteraceae bacterium]HRB02428.1 glycosyltransferase [Ilumatobacteraceae bacterium]